MTRKIRKAVFPAAGLGTRFLPATKATPKEMLPLVDKPLIQYVVEEAINSGIESIIIVTGRGKHTIEDHFDVAFELDKNLEAKGKHELLGVSRRVSEMARISYVRQKEALGLGHAVLMARDLVGDEPFAVMLGDDIIDSPVPCMRQMMDAYEKNPGSIIAIQEVPKRDISSYGVISKAADYETSNPRLYRLADLVEKPPAAEAPSNLAIIGRYILEPDIFESLEKTTPGRGGEIQLTDGMRGLISRHKPLYGFQFEGKRYDAGDKLGFLIATVEFALKHQDLSEDFLKYLKTLQLD